MSSFVDGDPNAQVMVIAMAPGREELKEDKPLVGGSGKLFWSMMNRKAGITRDQCFILNTIGEWPENSAGGPSIAQFNAYWQQFNDAMSKSHARIIILLGGDALNRVMGVKGGIEAWRGYLMRPEDRGYLTRIQTVQGVYKTSNKTRGIKAGDPKWEKVKLQELAPIPPSVEYILPTLHPAAVLRSGFAPLPAFAADIARAGRALRGELKPYRIDFGVRPELWGTQSYGGPTAFDIETPRDQGHRRVIERVGMATDKRTWTAPWSVSCKAATIDALRLASVRIAHNIAFDAPHLEANGVPVPEPWYDTMLAAAMLQPDLYKGLNPVASLYLDRPRWKHLSEEAPEYYNAQDANAELELYYETRRLLERGGQLRLFENTIMPTVPVLVDMTQQGIPLDHARRMAWCGELNEKRDDTFRRWFGLAGDVNPQSPKQLADYFYVSLGLPVQYNKYGGVTSDAAAIKTMLADPKCQEHKDVLETLLTYRQTSKLLETYAQVPVSDDGCIHPSWLPAGKDDDSFGKGLAGTWRITSHGPNFQNQPPEARKLYIPPPGFAFIEADWNQIEARIIQALSGDVALDSAIRSGLHAYNMRILALDKTRAKNAFYGWCYGAGKRTLRRTFLAHGFDISEAECGAILRRFDEAYPQVYAWRKSIQDEIARTYSLTNPFGLRRHFYRGGEDVPAALDYLPQSSAAMCMWNVARPLAGSLREIGGRAFALVHDSILIGVPATMVEEGTEMLVGHMERTFDEIKPGFRVPVEVKRGAAGVSWGDLTPMEAKVA